MNINELYDLVINKLETWVQEFALLLPNILLAALVTVAGIFLSKQLKKLVGRLLRRFDQYTTLTNLLLSAIYVTGIGITLFTALGILKLDKAVTSLLAGAGIIGLALAFAFQDIAANFMSGIFISLRKPLHVGDLVKISGYRGKVVKLNLRDTVIQTVQGPMVIIPNKMVFQNPIENFTLLGKLRFDLNVGVSYGEDLSRIENIVREAVNDIENLSREDEVTFFYTDFGDSSINFVVRLWVNSADWPVYKKVGSDAIISIKKAFDEQNIVIPFPIRTLDFGIKGGVPLNEMPVQIVKQGLDNNH